MVRSLWRWASGRVPDLDEVGLAATASTCGGAHTTAKRTCVHHGATACPPSGWCLWGPDRRARPTPRVQEGIANVPPLYDRTACLRTPTRLSASRPRIRHRLSSAKPPPQAPSTGRRWLPFSSWSASPWASSAGRRIRSLTSTGRRRHVRLRQVPLDPVAPERPTEGILQAPRARIDALAADQAGETIIPPGLLFLNLLGRSCESLARKVGTRRSRRRSGERLPD